MSDESKMPIRSTDERREAWRELVKDFEGTRQSFYRISGSVTIDAELAERFRQTAIMLEATRAAFEAIPAKDIP